MYCPKCGKRLPDGSTFCSGCGKKMPASAVKSTTNGSNVQKNIVKQTSGNNYKMFYSLYKKVPVYNAILIFIAAFIYGIVDASEEILIGYELGGAAFIIWLLIGAVAGGIVWFFSTLMTAATVVRTDAVLEMNEKLKNGALAPQERALDANGNAGAQPVASTAAQDELPDL